eukprot:tig00000342_g24228.t1
MSFHGVLGFAFRAVASATSVLAPTSESKFSDSERRLLSIANFDARVAVRVKGGVRELVFGEGAGKQHLVLLHGFGAGAAIWYRMIALLSSQFVVHALDWSVNRVKFDGGPKATETELVNLVERWREGAAIESFSILGHSLGGTVAALYSLSHPKRVASLVLASPAGISHGGAIDPIADECIDEPPPASAPLAWKAVHSLWLANVSPQFFVRGMGPFGPRLVERYVEQRYRTIPDEERDALKDFLFHSFVRPGDHSYFNRMMSPRVQLRRTLTTRLTALSTQAAFIYGDRDWMYSDAVEGVCQALALRGLSSPHPMFVPRSGHQLPIDNPDAFAQIVLVALREAAARDQPAQAPSGRSRSPGPREEAVVDHEE